MAANRSNSNAGQDDNENGNDSAGELRAGLQKARKEEIFFGAAIGSNGVRMAAGKKPVKASQLKELAEASGGGKKLSGKCKFVDGELVLDLEGGKAPAGADKTIRNYIKEATGFSWKVRLGSLNSNADAAGGNANANR